ncbi:MAG: hypothetical protein ABFS14_12940 [Gemmatimonadota bacterium]
MKKQQIEWPAWLEALRPDELTRQRLRGRIMAQAEPLLAARRALTWDEVASRWATMLVPAAAAVTLLFGGLALQAGPRAVTTQVGSAQIVDDSVSDLGLVLSYAMDVPAP